MEKNIENIFLAVVFLGVQLILIFLHSFMDPFLWGFLFTGWYIVFGLIGIKRKRFFGTRWYNFGLKEGDEAVKFAKIFFYIGIVFFILVLIIAVIDYCIKNNISL
ncbi:MAG: hypothetical protein AABX01_02950 [Candidatus Micrarchaeota archaeon]